MCRFLEGSSFFFDAAIFAASRYAWIYACLCFIWKLWYTALYLLSGWMEIYSGRSERRGRDQAKERVDGQAGWGREEMCIRSHCASNVITGSDSSMWHGALPICQSEIGRVTNGYHCYFPQPPPPPPPLTLMSVSLSSAEGEE